MDETWEKWFSDLEMDDELHLFNEHDMNSLEEELMKVVSSVPHDSDFASSSSSNNNGSCLKRNKQHANSNWEKNQVFSSCNLSFEDSTVVSNVPDKSFHEKPEKGRSSSQWEEHIMAERKRREKISTMLVELSAMVPGLKKLDKLSIIGKTIDYVKYLQNRVKDLQEEHSKTESVKCCRNNKSNDNISENSNNGLDRLSFPKVDASVSGKDVIIRVTCEKREHILTKLLSMLASHNLSIVCSSVLPFGTSALNISIIAKVQHLGMAIDDLVKNLNEDLLKFYITCNHD
ncbi:hypothetical protein VNO80_01908 [Phaseolus coccineus]|uniref:BHLH domain-containing protein n=1 Tax=Phaseolus coccineus TaxID=3886 RepID=A0AAN9X039_PHACN